MFEIAYESEAANAQRAKPLIGGEYERVLTERRVAFGEKFEQLFRLKAQHYAEIYG